MRFRPALLFVLCLVLLGGMLPPTVQQRINAIVRRTLEDVSVADMVRPMPLEFPLNAQPVPESKASTKAAPRPGGKSPRVRHTPAISHKTG